MQMLGEIDSWSIRFDYSCFKHNLFCISSTKNLVLNIGCDGSGVHCRGQNQRLIGDLVYDTVGYRFKKNIEFDPRIIKEVNRIFSNSFVAKVMKRLKRLWVYRR